MIRKPTTSVPGTYKITKSICNINGWFCSIKLFIVQLGQQHSEFTAWAWRQLCGPDETTPGHLGTTPHLCGADITNILLL